MHPTLRPGISAVRAVTALLLTANTTFAAQVTIDGPPGSGRFGTSVATLPNGNIVVTDPGFDAPGPIVDVGAVYLYRPDGTLISTLTGSTANDRVGFDGVTVLRSGNYLVMSSYWDHGMLVDSGAVTFGSATAGVGGVVSATNSLVSGNAGDRVGSYPSVTLLDGGGYVVATPGWDNGAAIGAGAVTFGSGHAGVSGAISPQNSLVGSTADDAVGYAIVGPGVTPLNNGNYVVRSTSWDNGSAADVGAATFGSGLTGVSGPVTPSNSLVGSTSGDRVGRDGVTALTNGNYVVSSALWDHGSAADAGAATFGSGITGISGEVSVANSLVGARARDFVGAAGVTALSNGNYVVGVPYWDDGTVSDAGAVTFGSGSSGVTGVVSPTNSLVGTGAVDGVGSGGITALLNGNYVVHSPIWDDGATGNVGAATFGSGTTGIVGQVSVANSLIGGSENDRVSEGGITPLANGNYVVRSRLWDNGAAADAGAATFGSGTSGISGVVSASNSLVGTRASDSIGSAGVVALANGNYVVGSPMWDNGAIADVGAATFVSGVSGIAGTVSFGNSLIGTTSGDSVGNVTPLSNGNYVVGSPSWDHGPVPNVGAVTWADGSSGLTGMISPANSLIGSLSDSFVGSPGVVALSNGNYAVLSAGWDDAALTNVGAVTFGSGISGIQGAVSATNSLVGSSPNDVVGNYGVFPLTNGNYVVKSDNWDNGAVPDGGAVTLGLRDGRVTGAITPANSVLGDVLGQNVRVVYSYDPVRNQLAVGQRDRNRVILHRPGIETSIAILDGTEDPSAVGQPVTFTARVTASPGAPIDGQVTFGAASGQNCVDATPTTTSATTVEFSCSMVFSSSGTTTVTAEYTGSLDYAYSGSEPDSHTTVFEAPLFGDGFEDP